MLARAPPPPPNLLNPRRRRRYPLYIAIDCRRATRQSARRPSCGEDDQRHCAAINTTATAAAAAVNRSSAADKHACVVIVRCVGDMSGIGPASCWIAHKRLESWAKAAKERALGAAPKTHVNNDPAATPVTTAHEQVDSRHQNLDIQNYYDYEYYYFYLYYWCWFLNVKHGWMRNKQIVAHSKRDKTRHWGMKIGMRGRNVKVDFHTAVNPRVFTSGRKIDNVVWEEKKKVSRRFVFRAFSSPNMSITKTKRKMINSYDCFVKKLKTQRFYFYCTSCYFYN